MSETSQNSGNSHKYEAADDVVLTPGRCFSIIFRGDWTLDLLLDSESNVSRDDILNSLDRIIQSYQEQKVKVSNDVLLLRYVWLEADKVRLTCRVWLNQLMSVLMYALNFLCFHCTM